MIKNLKIKFIFAIVSIISLIMFVILFSINIIMNNDIERKIVDNMKEIAINEGILKIRNPNLKPIHFSDEKNTPPPFNLNFSIKLDKNNNIIEAIYPLETNYTENEVNNFLEYALNNENTYGKKENISFFKMPKHYGQIIVFLDITNYNQTKQNLFYVSILVFVLSLIFIFIISYFLTEWIIKPVKENFEMQKQFIANASHELKTPLSVISTNISILSYENDFKEQKKWINNVKNETFKMNDLINKLLLLSKTENFNDIKNKENINISNIILNSILSYESIIFEEKRILKHNIEPNIFINSIEEDISTLIRIFLDNAIKYSSPNDIIEIILKKKNENVSISIFNTGIGVEAEKIKFLFDRFYRADTSRNKEIEGYGLGLAIAKKIIDNNKWKIKTESVYGNWTKFTITF